MFDTINSLRPYFFSLREIGESVCLDIKIPVHWNLDDEIIKSDVQLKVQDENEKYKLISFIAPRTKEGYDASFIAVKKIIKHNLEEEEKIKLFNATVDGLKDLFLNSSLDKLREISFIKDGVRDKQRTRKTEAGDRDGSDSDGTS